MWGMLPSRTMREIINSTKPFGVPTGGRAIDRTRLALWLCYEITCSWWNAPKHTHCAKCGSVRT